jgi:gluconokinase
MTIIIMGVTGSGKTTVGTLLAQQLGWTFADADDFHTPANKEKMSKGIGLTDADRRPWLNAIHDACVRWQAAGINGIVACSALKQSYRDLLQENVDVNFIYLRGSADLILERLGHRKGHYAKESLVASQFEALEEPEENENTHVVDIGGIPEEIVAEIRRQLKL